MHKEKPEHVLEDTLQVLQHAVGYWYGLGPLGNTDAGLTAADKDGLRGYTHQAIAWGLHNGLEDGALLCGVQCGSDELIELVGRWELLRDPIHNPLKVNEGG